MLKSFESIRTQRLTVLCLNLCMKLGPLQPSAVTHIIIRCHNFSSTLKPTPWSNNVFMNTPVSRRTLLLDFPSSTCRTTWDRIYDLAGLLRSCSSISISKAEAVKTICSSVSLMGYWISQQKTLIRASTGNTYTMRTLSTSNKLTTVDVFLSAYHFSYYTSLVLSPTRFQLYFTRRTNSWFVGVCTMAS